jgi:hypothetical protein
MHEESKTFYFETEVKFLVSKGETLILNSRQML